MPIYEYQCDACGHHLEVMQKIADDPLKECPECHKPSLNKLVSAAGIQFKGKGWYKTDYSNKGKQPKTDDTGTGSKETKPTDTKPKEPSSSSDTGAKT